MTDPLRAPSPFLALPPTAHVARNALAFALRDKYPVAPGHTLVVPFRHIATWFDATRDEQLALLELVDDVKRALDAGVAQPDGTVRSPDGYNVGWNAGEAAGQTVMHLHVHVIPRYAGDMDDPRGGVRGVIPGKQKYAGMSPPRAAPAFAQLAEFVHGDELHFEDTLRRALLEADRADLLSAFVQTSGVERLREDLRDALGRGVRIRLLTGDYLGITSPDALAQLLRLAEEHAGFAPYLYEAEQEQAFHPKAYLFWKGAHGVAYVGSSNLSRSALTDGVEWNLRLVSDADGDTLADVQQRFDSLVTSARSKPLTPELIEAYRQRVPERTVPELPGPGRELRARPPAPNAIQLEALAALKQARADDKKKGLVVLATGLGKTFLSAFDFAACGGERVLFVAHREEILGQAKDAWQAVFPDKTVGTYRGAVREREVELLFASVQTIARKAHLSQFKAQHFDYIVIDEFHHAAAATYRKLLGHFKPRFLLGLTATPERMDGRSLLELCDDNLIFRRDLIHGISQRLLVPFRYFGIKDSVDFEPIPWRSGKFDAAELSAAVSTEARAEQALREYERHAQPIGNDDSLPPNGDALFTNDGSLPPDVGRGLVRGLSPAETPSPIGGGQAPALPMKCRHRVCASDAPSASAAPSSTPTSWPTSSVAAARPQSPCTAARRAHRARRLSAISKTAASSSSALSTCSTRDSTSRRSTTS